MTTRRLTDIRGLKHAALLAALLLAASLLSGCLYPQERRGQNQVSPKEAVRNVQGAIEQYFADKSMLPIKNADSGTPVYEKFLIDFAKLQREGYMSSIPTAAFENGGNYYFLITDEENTRQVKLMDIVTYQKINDIQSWVRSYVQTSGKLPLGDEMYEGFYLIDYKALNKKEPEIVSQYSRQTLQAVIDNNGTVYTDYGIDIMQLLQKDGTEGLEPGLDLRELLVAASDYVPVKAPVYHLIDGEPRAVN